MPGIHSTTHKYGKVHTGHTGHLTDMMVKEHQQHNHFYLPKKCAVAENSINLDHHFQLQNASTLVKKSKRMDRSSRKQQESRSIQKNEQGRGFLPE
jgi:hypothetical protein